MAIGPGSLDIGGEKVLGFTIPKINVAGVIKTALGLPATNLQQEISKTVQKGVMVPILIGAGTIALTILIVAWMNKG